MRQGQELPAAWDHPETWGLGAECSRARFVSSMGGWETKLSWSPGGRPLIKASAEAARSSLPTLLGVELCC